MISQMTTLLVALDLLGTFVFALSGALVGVRHRLDLFGVRHLHTLTVLRHLRQILSSNPRLRGRALVTEHDVDELVLTARHPVPLQVDGDDLGDRTRVVMRAVRGALQVVV